MLRQLPGSRPDRSGLIAVFIELRIQRIPTVFLPYTSTGSELSKQRVL